MSETHFLPLPDDLRCSTWPIQSFSINLVIHSLPVCIRGTSFSNQLSAKTVGSISKKNKTFFSKCIKVVKNVNRTRKTENRLFLSFGRGATLKCQNFNFWNYLAIRGCNN